MKIKKTICLLSLFISIAAFASSKSSNKVIITGVVENVTSSQNFVEIGINRFAFQQKIKRFKIDKEGRFKCEFNISQATDLWFDYRTNFQIAVHPGDSIHVIFDGAQKERSELLKSIKFSGMAGKLNQDIALLQQKYFDSELYIYASKGNKKNEKEIIKRSSPEKYTDYLYKLKDEIYNSFVNECKPEKEACMWADFYLKTSVLVKISQYSKKHKEYNDLKSLTLPSNYYDVFLDVLPITDSMLICGASISRYTNWYHSFYLQQHKLSNSGNLLIVAGTKNKPPTSEELKNARKKFKNVSDSIIVNGIIKHTSDTLLRQMVLTEYFLFELERADISAYEKYHDVIQEYIKRPFLLNPLTAYYKKTKKSVEKPELNSDEILKASANSTISELMDSLLVNHKNKVIYIDCWATYCGPCLAEMSNSKMLMNEMKGKDVAFVYFCIDSEEKKWKALIDKHQLKGEHYLLSKAQSDDLRRIYEIAGIPHYIFIDKEGTVLGKDYNLRPQEAMSAIVKLLKK